MEQTNEDAFPVANVDDTVGFMAAARALHQKRVSTAPAGSQNGVVSVSELGEDGDTAYSNNLVDIGGATEEQEPLMDLASDYNPDHSSTSAKVPEKNTSAVVSDGIPFDSRPHLPVEDAPVKDAPLKEKENREHMLTFATWGTPEERDKPAACVRRVIITGLPSAWRTAAKVLSLIHGGVVESVSLTPTGKAHVLFCDHEACDAFYEKYPNGIDIGQKATVFVEKGKEVDVVSSALSFNLSVGSTRVVRAVGVDMNFSMARLYALATSKKCKVEKIVDVFEPDQPRSVVFRFCNIDDAVRFKGMLIRDEDWEHCNVQFAVDPCEVATGRHVD